MPQTQQRPVVAERMTADDLIAALSGLPGVRRLAASLPVEKAVLVAGIEIACTRETSDNLIRRVWRERQRGGAAPLLLVADETKEAGTLIALGVLDAGGP